MNWCELCFIFDLTVQNKKIFFIFAGRVDSLFAHPPSCGGFARPANVSQFLELSRD